MKFVLTLDANNPVRSVVLCFGVIQNEFWKKGKQILNISVLTRLNIFNIIEIVINL